MKKLHEFCAARFLLILLAFSTIGAVPAAPKSELVFYNWTAYFDSEVQAEFERKYNVKIREEYYQSADQRDEKLMRNGGKGFDVIMLGGPYVTAYAKRGWIVPLSRKKISNFAYVDKRWLNAWQEIETYALPYLWGTTGIVYRKDLVKNQITSWKQFYQPEQSLKGKIMVINMHRLGIGFALKSLGFSYNSSNEQELQEVEKLLLAHKPYVQTYGYFKTDADSGIVNGDTWMGQAWNGDALLLQKRNPNISYVLPKEGGEIWADYLTISSFSNKQDLAHKFVNFLHEPRVNSRLATVLEYATPNIKAKELVPRKHLENPVIYPSQEALKNCEYQQNLPPKITRKMILIWSRLIH